MQLASREIGLASRYKAALREPPFAQSHPLLKEWVTIQDNKELVTIHPHMHTLTFLASQRIFLRFFVSSLFLPRNDK
jgi:hypothetical protein